MSGVSVRDVMRPGVVTCLPDDPLARVAAIMVTHGIHAVVLAPIEQGVPLVTTDLDLVRAALERPDALAHEIAREPLTTLAADTPLEDATAMMSERGVGHLLVTEASGAPAGIISTFDVAAVIGGQQPRVARMLRPGPARPSSSARTLAQARVGEVMHVGIATCVADASLSSVARSMAEQRVHCMAVAGIERQGQHLTWGLIGDLDLVAALHRGALNEPAASIAVTSPIAVQETDSLERAAALMVEHETSHVVVCGSSGLPAGMVSTLDIASVLGAAA
jgi:CBS domain-containing protein